MTGMTGTPIDLIWVIPALPLAAIILNFFVIRWFDVASQRPHPPAAVETPGGAIAINPHAPAQELYQEEPGTTHPTGPAGHGLTPPQVHAEHEEEEHGGIGGLNIWATLVSIVSLLAVLASFIISCLIGYQFLTTPSLQANGTPVFNLYNWFSFGNLSYPIDFRIDTLTVVMLIVVTGVSTLVHLYSIGYMAKDVGYSRFFIELSLFTFSMLILVLGANFLVLFIGWELVGLSSYLLIGFFYGAAPPPRGSEVPYPPPAQLKAFVTTRLGDFGFLIGILILWSLTGTFSFVGELAFFRSAAAVNVGLVTVAMILVFCGAVGKSAQFPLHIWLPDAMAGPTPVSALIHAATMVAAGVYLVARLFPLYSTVAGPQAMLVVGYIGGFTALFAATIALTQYDIKGVLAYSTISQLGYMFVGLAMASTNAIGMNHLFTHAFFKALLFLGSGAVIHAIANQDMRFMGGLARFLPITALTMLVATLAISGIPPFSGFWSKDPIIAAALDSGQPVLYAMTLFTAFLTAFYMFRLYFLTFGGPGGSPLGFWGGTGQYRGEAHPHAPAWVMWLPLAILALVTVAIGLWGFAGYDSFFATFLNGGTTPHVAATPAFDDPLTLVGIGVAVVGVLLAWAMYGVGAIPRNAFTSNAVGSAIHRLLYNRYYLNELYIDVIVRYGALGLAGACAWFDAHIIDGIVNSSARGVLGIGRVTRRSETGFLQNYGAAIFGGALLLMLILFFAVGALGR